MKLRWKQPRKATLTQLFLSGFHAWDKMRLTEHTTREKATHNTCATFTHGPVLLVIWKQNPAPARLLDGASLVLEAPTAPKPNDNIKETNKYTNATVGIYLQRSWGPSLEQLCVSPKHGFEEKPCT